MDYTFICIWLVVLVILLLLPFIKWIKGRLNYQIFSPECFLSIYLVYYIIVPAFSMTGRYYGRPATFGVLYLLTAVILFVIFFKIGFRQHIKYAFFKRTNALFTEKNIFRIALRLSLICFGCYFLIKGFSFNIVQEQSADAEMIDTMNHADTYILNFVSFLPLCACLFYVHKNKYLFFSIVTLSLFIYIMAGFRYRILLMFAVIFTFIHLYPKVKRINFKVWIPVAFVLFVAMGIIEKSRSYGKGLDIDKVLAMKEEGFHKQEAKENIALFYYSAQVMKLYSNKDLIYLEPLYTALTMPIPRAIFPGKPTAQYQKDANIAVYGGTYRGHAFFSFVEGYISFGWLGVLLYAYVMGLISKLFWNNYKKNKHSIGAILLLASYNAILFVFISRGHLAQDFTQFMYYIPICFWMCRLVSKKIVWLSKGKKKMQPKRLKQRTEW